MFDISFNFLALFDLPILRIRILSNEGVDEPHS